MPLHPTASPDCLWVLSDLSAVSESSSFLSLLLALGKRLKGLTCVLFFCVFISLLILILVPALIINLACGLRTHTNNPRSGFLFFGGGPPSNHPPIITSWVLDTAFPETPMSRYPGAKTSFFTPFAVLVSPPLLFQGIKMRTGR